MLKALIQQGENDTLEFKQSFDKETIVTVRAFANTKGGKILIGIKDSGDVQGIPFHDELQQQDIDQIKTQTEPGVIVDIEQAEIEKKTVLIIHVGEFPIKPVSFKGRFFQRKVNSNHQMTLTEIANMHLQSLQLSWDSYPAHGLSWQDLDESKVDKFIKRVNETGRFSLQGEAQQAFEKLILLKKGQITQAARLLFAKEQTLYNIHIGRFKTPTMILDDQMIRASLFDAVAETMRIIISHIKVAFEFTGAIQRTEIFEYPVTALRELVLNAIVHREYTSTVDVQIKIFDQAITIFNPGKLYGDLTVEQLKTDSYPSRTRNKLIAEAYLTGDIEKYGRGSIRVRQAIKEYPSMRFDYQESGDGFMVSMAYDFQKADKLKLLEQKEAPQEIKYKLSTKQKICQLINENKHITRKELALEVGVSDDAKKQQLAALKKAGKLYWLGSTKAGHWQVNNDR